MAAFAEPADVAGVLGETIDEDRAGLLLELASDAVRGELGQQLTETTETLPVTARDGLLILPELPVTGLVAITTAAGVLIPSGDYTWTPAGIVSRTDCRPWAGTVTVTYTHGYQTVPAVARRVTIQVALRAYTNPQQLEQETVGGYLANSGPAAAAGTLSLTVTEKRDLDPLRP